MLTLRKVQGVWGMLNIPYCWIGRWRAKTWFQKACGIDSQHFMHLTQAEKTVSPKWSIENLQAMKAVLLASQDDYDGSYLTSVRNLVQAEAGKTCRWIELIQINERHALRTVWQWPFPQLLGERQ
jgi:hypothetical protein